MKFRINNIFSKRFTIAILSFSVLILISALYNIKDYLFDGTYYWTVADEVFENGFELLSYPETFRGYLFPVIIGFAKYIMKILQIDEYWGWRILASFMVSCLLAYILPIIFNQNSNENYKKKVMATLATLGAIILFWGDFLQYPLSDIPAVFFLLSAVAIAIKIMRAPVGTEHMLWKGGALGAFLYAAYNTRAAFLYGVVIILLIFFIVSLAKAEYKKVLCIIPIVIGVLVFALPQMCINHKYVGIYSPKVYTEQLFGYQNNLEKQQVFWGLTNQRYETYIGDVEEYSSPTVFFLDPIGNEIVARENISAEEFDYGTIIKLFLKYPLDIVGIYTRHLFNLLTPVFPQSYITNMYFNKTFFISLAIIVWMIVGLGVVFSEKNNDNMKLVGVLLFGAIFPSLLQMAGAVELRFFFIGHLLAYYYIFNVVDYKHLFYRISKCWIYVVTVCLIIFFLWVSVIGSTLAYNSEKVLLINDKKYEHIDAD